MRTTLLVLMMMAYLPVSCAQRDERVVNGLSRRQKSIVAISALTACGNIPALKEALDKGLDAGLTVNEIKETFIHIAAYCGFPRSLNGINAFIAVSEGRRLRGITDRAGPAPGKVPATPSRYEIGKKNLAELSGGGADQNGNVPKSGYAQFVPAIDTMLKEHLFADIFGRGVLSNQDRELITVSALTGLGKAEPQLQSHLSLALGNGLSVTQLGEMFLIGEKILGKKEADAGRQVLSRVLKAGNRKR